MRAVADLISAARTPPRMPFPEPETALISTSRCGGRENLIREITRASCGIPGGIYLFSITYTKTQ